MNVTLIMPKSASGIAKLNKQVAEIHAQAVVSSIQKMTCSREKKSLCLDSVIQQTESTIEHRKAV